MPTQVDRAGDVAALEPGLGTHLDDHHVGVVEVVDNQSALTVGQHLPSASVGTAGAAVPKRRSRTGSGANGAGKRRHDEHKEPRTAPVRGANGGVVMDRASRVWGQHHVVKYDYSDHV